MRATRFAALALLAAALPSAVPAASLVLDDFSSGPYKKQQASGASTASRTGSMIGGERMTVFTVCSLQPCGSQNPFGQSAGFQVRGATQFSPAALIYSAGYKTFPRLDVFYGASSPLHLNLASAYDRIRVSFDAADQVVNFNLELFTGGAYSLSGCNLDPSTNPFSVDFPLEDFTAGADLGDVTMIDLIFGSGSAMGANDFAVTAVEAISADEPPAQFICHGFGS